MAGPGRHPDGNTVRGRGERPRRFGDGPPADGANARDIPGTTARLDEAADYLVMDLLNFLGRLEKTAAHT
jgi:hypothetical protein